jgi:hypothetical protein
VSAAIQAKNLIAEKISITSIITAAAAGLIGIGAGKQKGGKIDTGIKVNTNTKDDTLILANRTETILTEEHVKKLGGPEVMKRIGVPGYVNGGYVGSNIPMFLNGGFINMPMPVAQTNFATKEINELIKSVNAKTDLINESVNATNNCIDRLEVYNVVNKLNNAQKQFEVVNQTNKI